MPLLHDELHLPLACANEEQSVTGAKDVFEGCFADGPDRVC